MRAKDRYRVWAAFRRGRLLYGVFDARKAVVARYYRAVYAQEVARGDHDPRTVLADHGIHTPSRRRPGSR